MKVTVSPNPIARPPVTVRIELDRPETENLYKYLVQARAWDMRKPEDALASELTKLLTEFYTI